MQVRKIFYMLALSIALQPCTAGALFEKWSTRELVLSLYSVVITATLVAVLYRNWPHKTEKQNSVVDQKNKTEKQIEEKTVPKVVTTEKKVQETLSLDTKPEENADIELQKVVEQYAPASEPKLQAEKIWTSTDNGALANTEKSHVNFILFKLKEDNKPKLIKFINKTYLSVSARVPFGTHPQACDSGRDMVNRFARYLQGHYYYAANLLLSTGLLDTEKKYGCYRDSKDNTVKATNSFLGWLMWLSKGFTGNAGEDSNSKDNKDNKPIDYKVMLQVMGSHGAKTFNGEKEGGEEVVQNDEYKITIKPIPEYKEKLFFSADGTRAVTKTEFVKELKTFLQQK